MTAGPGAYPPGHLNSPPGPGNLLVIHVAGKVRRPGVIRASAGSRVTDAITAAGGALPGVDLSTVNLARPLTDGEQILVGFPATTPNPPPPSAAGPARSPSNPSRQVNLNTATLADLESLPGVGPVLAQRILDYRTEHGRFATIDELQDVTGVGAKKFDSLKPHVHV